MMVLLGLMIVLTLFALAAHLWGADSRDESDDPRRPDYPVGLK